MTEFEQTLLFAATGVVLRRYAHRVRLAVPPHPTATGLTAARRYCGCETQVVEVDRGEPLQALGLDGRLRARLAVDDDGDGDGLGALAAQRLDGLERRLTRRRGVLEHDDALARDIGPLDLAAAAVVLRLLAHDERVERGVGARRLVHHGVRDRVGAEGESADRDDAVDVADQVEHDAPDRGRRAVVERELAHVDVVGGLLAAGQREVAVEHGLVRDEGDEGLAVGFEFGRGGGGHASSLRMPHPPHRRR